MAKLSLPRLASAQAASIVSAINSAFALIETALENTLSRDGTTPNTMEDTLDMNSERLINLPEPLTSAEPVRKAEWDAEWGNLDAAVSAAVNAQVAAENAADEFGDIWLGTFGVDPVVDNDGNPLQTGALYYNSGDHSLKTYTGSSWAAAATGSIIDSSEIDVTYVGSTASLSLITGSIDETKLDASTNASLDLADGSLQRSGGTMTGAITAVTPTTSLASLNLPHGTAPTSPTNGDMWTTTVALSLRLNGNTQNVTFNGATQTLTNKTLTAPKFASGGFIADANGNEQIIFTTTTSAVNEFTFTNAITGVNPSITASGGDTNIGINLVTKGSGIVQANGVAIDTISSTATLTNKTISLGSNTISGTLAQFNTAISDDDIMPVSGGTFTGKVTTLASASGNAGLNIPAGVVPTSPVIGDIWLLSSNGKLQYRTTTPSTQTLVTEGGTATLTTKTIDLTNNTLTMTLAQLNTAVSDADVVATNTASTYTAGAKQTFVHSGTTAGFNLSPVAGDPSTPANGDIWYNSTTGTFRKQQAGVVSNLDTTGGGGSVVTGATSVAFTDGDTMRRVTISDGNVSGTSKIIGTITRPSSADDSADLGYFYNFCVVRLFTGGFDAIFNVRDFGGDDCSELPPNETVTFNYMVV